MPVALVVILRYPYGFPTGVWARMLGMGASPPNVVLYLCAVYICL